MAIRVGVNSEDPLPDPPPCRGREWRGRGMDRAAVALNEVVVAFRVARGGTFTAVERASLRVESGEFVAIVGPTGCGKSTLLNIAAGLITPFAGSVEIF